MVRMWLGQSVCFETTHCDESQHNEQSHWTCHWFTKEPPEERQMTLIFSRDRVAHDHISHQSRGERDSRVGDAEGSYRLSRRTANRSLIDLATWRCLVRHMIARRIATVVDKVAPPGWMTYLQTRTGMVLASRLAPGWF